MLLELHLRAAHSAAANSRGTWKLMKLLDLNLRYQHMHIVGPKPDLNSAKNKVLLLDFLVRTNLLLDLIEVYINYSAISPTKNVRPLSNSVIQFAEKDLLAEKNKILGSREGFAAWHGENKYDQEGVWGIELRHITDFHKRELNDMIFEILQENIIEQKYLDEELLQANGLDINFYENEGGLAYYNINNYKDHSHDLFPLNIDSSGFPIGLNGQHIELQMLSYDWSQMSVFFNHTEKLENIKKSQSIAIAKIKEYFKNKKYTGSSEQVIFINQVMRQFIGETQILNDVAGSFGLNLSDISTNLFTSPE